MLKICIILLCIGQLVAASPQKKYHAGVEQFFAKEQKAARAMVYEVKDAKFSRSSFDALARALKLDPGKTVETETQTRAGNRESRFLQYDDDLKEYYFCDFSVKGLRAGDCADTARFRMQSDAFVQKYIANAKAQYQYVLRNLELVSENGNPQLEYVEFRFVRMLNERYISDLSNYVTLRVGEGGKIRSIRYAESRLLPLKYCDRQLKSQKYKERLNRVLDDTLSQHLPDGRKARWKSVAVGVAGNTYYSVQRNGTTVLEPFVDFHTTNVNEDGSEVLTKISLPVSLQPFDTISSNDFDDYTVPECTH